MRFHGLMLLRDEADILAESLARMLEWIDNLYILDLGSTDGSWEIVQDFAARDKRIVPCKSAPIIYSDGLRCMLFDRYRKLFDPGDWVMKIDADEIYHIPPPRFVEQRLGRLDGAVYLQWYFFRLVKSEVDAYESGQVDVAADRKRSIEDRRRYYKISQYSEPRMFRYRRSMQWPANVFWPFNFGYVSRSRIPIRHYPHRDPIQMAARFRLRARMMSLNAAAGGHWKLENWRDEVVDEQGVAESSKGKLRGLSGERGIDTGQLHYWTPGTALEEQIIQSHVGSPLRRAIQRVAHPLLLPILDAQRKRYDPDYQPAEIPAGIQQELRVESSRRA
jgi:hypothetical protein